MVKFSEKIGILIPDFKLFFTPGPRKINDFTNQIFFLYKDAYAQTDKFCIKMPSSTWKYLPIWPNGQKTDFGRFLFGHVATIRVSLKMGLDGFFGLNFLLETIKSTYLLDEIMTFLSNPGGSKSGGQSLHPMFLNDKALKLFVRMASDS